MCIENLLQFFFFFGTLLIFFLSAQDTGTIFVVVGSTNPVKINAARKAFQQVFNANIIEASGTSVPSGVCDQPMSDAETKQGACQRALNAREAFRQSSITSSHFFVGMEGGVDDHSNEMVCFAWMAVIRGNSTAISSSRTATFSLPPRLRQLILGVLSDSISPHLLKLDYFP